MTVNPLAKPRRDGLRSRLLRYFKDCPHDVLTVEAAAEKFGVTWVEAFNCRKYMQRLGELGRGTMLRAPERERH